MPPGGAVLDLFEHAEQRRCGFDGGVPGGAGYVEPVGAGVSDEVTDQRSDDGVEEGAGHDLFVEVDELAGEVGAFIGRAHIAGHVQVEELAGGIEVLGNLILVDAEHGADHAPGVEVCLGSVDAHVDTQAVQAVQDQQGEEHLPADHVLLTDGRAEAVGVPAVFALEVVADGGVQQPDLLCGRDEAAARFEGVGLHEVDRELSGLRHALGGVLQGSGWR